MDKKFKYLRYSATILCLIEFITIMILLLFYGFNAFSFQSYFKSEYFGYFALAIILLDIIFIFLCLYLLNSIKQSNILKSVDIIGSDLNIAYEFGKVGFVITDNDSNVIWVSESLSKIRPALLNKNIFDVLPTLNRFINQEENTELEFTFNGVYYSARYLPRSKTYIFKDITDFVSLRKTKEAEALCLGIILIDNYSDIVGTGDTYSNAISLIRGKINDYCAKFHLLLRSYRNDAYLIICTHENLTKLIDDRFSLLDQVRSIQTELSSKPTLSISFAYEFNDPNKLMEMADQGIALATSRGGDQAVVHHYNSEIKYFGGKTQSIESRNKVKVKGTADSIINFITSSSNVIVMGHKNMDMDAFGSCLAVKAICESFSKKCTIAGTKDDCEEKVRIAANSTYVIKELFANYKTLIEEEIQEKTLLIVVDVSNPDLTIYPDIIDKCNKVIVIDHHRRSEKFIEGAILSYNDPSASSASELLAELIKYSTYSRDIKIDKQEATFLYSGILLDTNHFKSLSVGIRTFEACAILKEYGADNIKAENYLKDDYEMFTEINEIVHTRKVYKADTVWYCKAEKAVMNDSTLSKAANQCMDLSGVKSVFVIGKIYNGDVKISARSDGTVNVQKICEKMGGGGHFGMASCRFKDKTVDEVENILISTLNDNLNEALSK